MSLTAHDIMNPDVVTARHDLSLHQLVLLLQTNAITGLPVLDGEGELVGVVSTRDLVRVEDEQAEEERSHYHARTSGSISELDEWQDDGRDLTVGDIMSVHVVSAGPNTSVKELAATMVDHDIHRVVILDGSTLDGIVGSLDILRAVSLGRLS